MTMLCLSHDVEGLYHPNKLARVLSWFLDSNTVENFLNDKNPFNTFDKIVRLEKEYKTHSTFFFLSRRYPLETKYGKKILNKLETNGSEISLHSDLNSFNNATALKEEKKKLDDHLKTESIGVRQHFIGSLLNKGEKLNLDQRKKAGFLYDSSLFRFRKREDTFKPFFTKAGLLEIPMSIIDRDYMQYNSLKKIWKEIKEKINSAEKINGVCTINWHTHMFPKKPSKTWQKNYFIFENFDKIYEKILKYAGEQGIKTMTCKEVYETYKR